MAFSCAVCGVSNQASDRSCHYCHSALCTVRCARCYQMNPPQAIDCQSCGTELGLEPIELPQQIECVECSAPMKAYNGAPGVLHDCESCGGQFVDHVLLHDLLQRRSLYGRQVPPRLVRANPTIHPVRYFKCPLCEKQLLRQNFGGQSGIIVHQCVSHGTWFHSGELPRVIAFVEAGGLREAKQAQLGPPKPLTDEARRALEEALQQAREQREDPYGIEAALGVRKAEQEIFEDCVALLGTLGTWLKGRKSGAEPK